MQVCRICLGTDCKLYPMTSNKVLCRAYETLTGLSTENNALFSPYMCIKCSHELLNCAHFRSQSLKSHLILLEVVKKRCCITLELIQSVIRDQNSCLSNNDSEQYELDMELVEREHETEGAADTRQLPGLLVDDIKNEQDDVIITDFDNGGSNTAPEDMTSLDNVTAVVKIENYVKQEVFNEDNIEIVDLDFSDLHGDLAVEIKREDNELIIPDVLNKDTNVVAIDVFNLHGDVNDEDKAKDVINSDIINKECLIDEREDDTVFEVEDKVKDVVLNSYIANEGSLIVEREAVPHYEVIDVVKMENVDIVFDCDSKELINNNGVQGNEFDGEDWKDELRSTVAPEVTVTQDLYHTTTEAYGGLSADKELSCDICPYRTTTPTLLQTHLKSHIESTSYNCMPNKYITISKETMPRYIRVRSGEKPYLCSICNKAFSKKPHLKIHLRIHSGEKPYSCNLCTKAFNRKVYLQAHLRIHSGEKPYSCNICSKAFIRKGDLEKHFRIHTDEKPYSCDICQKAYKAKSDLRIHLRTHTGEKPYPCSICDKAYNRNFELQAHLRTHTGEKPYSCHVCTKAFFRKGDLQRHLQIHVGAEDKPYPCNVCKKAFIRKADLKRHLRIHCGEKPHS